MKQLVPKHQTGNIFKRLFRSKRNKNYTPDMSIDENAFQFDPNSIQTSEMQEIEQYNPTIDVDSNARQLIQPINRPISRPSVVDIPQSSTSTSDTNVRIVGGSEYPANAPRVGDEVDKFYKPKQKPIQSVQPKQKRVTGYGTYTLRDRLLQNQPPRYKVTDPRVVAAQMRKQQEEKQKMLDYMASKVPNNRWEGHANIGNIYPWRMQ